MMSWSWEGEDVLARKIMLDVFGVAKGFYVDIGAHHPFNLSNTALLYQEGWRGINIDAMPGSMKEFRRHRPQDVNLEVAISDTPGTGTFYMWSEPGLNGFLDEATVRAHQARGITLQGTAEVACRPINDVLGEHAAGRTIDLMNIDAEGLDIRILRAMDFERWRPTLVIVETLGMHFMEDVLNAEITAFMEENGFGLFSRLHFSCFFVDRARYARRHDRA